MGEGQVQRGEQGGGICKALDVMGEEGWFHEARRERTRGEMWQEKENGLEYGGM